MIRQLCARAVESAVTPGRVGAQDITVLDSLPLGIACLCTRLYVSGSGPERDPLHGADLLPHCGHLGKDLLR